MLEVRSLIHINRYFATKTSVLDLFRAVQYYHYKGEIRFVPKWYRITIGTSCVTDLAIDDDKILALMKSNTRNEIRRAIKEGIQFETISDIDEFVVFYNEFCKTKGLDDVTSRYRMQKYKNLLLSKAVYNGETLAMHASALDEKSKTSFLMFSCSRRFEADIDKKLIGWGNRYFP